MCNESQQLFSLIKNVVVFFWSVCRVLYTSMHRGVRRIRRQCCIPACTGASAGLGGSAVYQHAQGRPQDWEAVLYTSMHRGVRRIRRLCCIPACTGASAGFGGSAVYQHAQGRPRDWEAVLYISMHRGVRRIGRQCCTSACTGASAGLGGSLTGEILRSYHIIIQHVTGYKIFKCMSGGGGQLPNTPKILHCLVRMKTADYQRKKRW